MSTANKYTDLRTPNQVDKAAQALASLIVVPLLLTACWNFGLTDVIHNLGGPDADVNVLQGALAVYAVTGLSKLFQGKGL